MWTSENRGRYDRSKLRYPSDLTDEEWAVISTLIPPATRGGNKRTVVVREIFDGLMHVLGTGCQSLPAGHSKNAPKGAALPKDLPLRSTVNDCFCRWNHDGTLDRIQYALYARCREMAGRNSSPTAAIIPSR